MTEEVLPQPVLSRLTSEWGLTVSSTGAAKLLKDVPVPDWSHFSEALLDADLRKLEASPAAPLPQSTPLIRRDSPLFTQLVEVRDITVPSRCAGDMPSSASRTLHLTVHDGTQKWTLVEFVPCKQLSVSLPPGTKLLLDATPTRPLVIRHGIGVLSSPEQVRVLGGHVERLVSNWEANRGVESVRAAHAVPRNMADPPPKFVSFSPTKSLKLEPAEATTLKKKGQAVPQQEAAAGPSAAPRFALQDVAPVPTDTTTAPVVPKQKVSLEAFQQAESASRGRGARRPRRGRDTEAEQYMVQRRPVGGPLVSDSIFGTATTPDYSQEQQQRSHRPPRGRRGGGRPRRGA